MPARRTLEGELLDGRRGLARQTAQDQHGLPSEGDEWKGRGQGLSLIARHAVTAYEGYAHQEESEYLRTALGIDIYA